MHTDRLQQVRANQRGSQEGVDRLQAALSRMESRLETLEGNLQKMGGEIGKMKSATIAVERKGAQNVQRRFGGRNWPSLSGNHGHGHMNGGGAVTVTVPGDSLYRDASVPVSLSRALRHAKSRVLVRSGTSFHVRRSQKSPTRGATPPLGGPGSDSVSHRRGMGIPFSPAARRSFHYTVSTPGVGGENARGGGLFSGSEGVRGGGLSPPAGSMGGSGASGVVGGMAGMGVGDGGVGSSSISGQLSMPDALLSA